VPSGFGIFCCNPGEVALFYTKAVAAAAAHSKLALSL